MRRLVLWERRRRRPSKEGCYRLEDFDHCADNGSMGRKADVLHYPACIHQFMLDCKASDAGGARVTLQSSVSHFVLDAKKSDHGRARGAFLRTPRTLSDK